MNYAQNTPIDHYAVIGHPISHSQSPWIHTEFARQTAQVLEYTRLPAPLEGFVATATVFAEQGGRGLNVTLPFKEQAYAMADVLSPRATLAGAVNTLRIECDEAEGAEGPGEIRWYGDNTDGVGLVRDLERHLQRPFQASRVLLLGAGGAARGALAALLEKGLSEIIVFNRTAARAQELVMHFAKQAALHGCRLQAANTLSPPEIKGSALGLGGAFDVIVNASAASLEGSTLEIPASVWHSSPSQTLAYDMMYGSQPTPFMQQALQYGARAADGLGMLVEQAAESFYVWRGVRPSVEPVLAALRARLT